MTTYRINWVDEEGDPMEGCTPPTLEGPLTVEMVIDALEKATETYRTCPTFTNLTWWEDAEMSDVITFSFFLDTSGMVIIGMAKPQ